MATSSTTNYNFWRDQQPFGQNLKKTWKAKTIAKDWTVHCTPLLILNVLSCILDVMALSLSSPLAPLIWRVSGQVNLIFQILLGKSFKEKLSKM